MSTAQPEPEPVDIDGTLTAYEVALAALVAYALAETADVFDHWVGRVGLLDEVPRRSLRMLAHTLARSWSTQAHRARVIASLTGSVITDRPPIALPEPAADLPRLIEAAETLLDRSRDMKVGAEAVEEPLTFEDFEDEVRHDRARMIRQAIAEVHAAEQEAARVRREQEIEERAEAADIVRLEAEIEAQRSAEDDEERHQRIEEHRAALRAEKEAQRARAERQRAEDAEFYAAKRREAEEREQARREARAERRRAQVARAQNIARAEVTRAAAETLPKSFREDPRFEGWVRKVNDGACQRCFGWWLSGGDPKAPSPVRPWSVPMKRHNGCTCTQHPVTKEEADARGRTDEPEPRLRNKPTKPRPDADTDG